MGARFVPAGFQHNGRVAWALIPSLLILMGYGGSAFAGILVVGCMVVYILDSIGYREGAFTAVWAVMGLANVVILLSGFAVSSDKPMLLSTLLVLLYGAALFLTGVWGTLQFKWVQLQYPAVALAFEKLLVVGCLPVAAMVQVFGIAEALGATEACWYLGVLSCFLYHLFALPLRSSFYPSGKAPPPSARLHPIGPPPPPEHVPPEVRVQGRFDAGVCCLMTLVLPPAFYCAVHSRVLVRWEHIFSVLLLTSMPALFIAVLPNGLWWASARSSHGPRHHSSGGGSHGSPGALRLMLGGLALMVGLAGFEGRVLFRAFGEYIPLHPPASYVFVTAALYGSVAVGACYAAGLLGDVSVGSVPGAAALLSVGLGSLAFGLPLWVLPAPLLGAMGLGMFLESRQLREYMIFVVGCMVTACWFVWHHFWFLDVVLAGMGLRPLCLAALAALAPALLLPGMVATNTHSKLTSSMLAGQALLVAVLEQHLYAGEHEEQGSEMYPSYLVLATSAAGYLATNWLRDRRFIGPSAGWLIKCTLVAKTSMLVLPEAQLLFPVLALTCAVSLPNSLYNQQRAHGMARPRVTAIQGLLLATAVLLATAFARFAIFDVVQWASDSRPSEAVLLGCLLVAGAGGCVPLVVRFFPAAAGPRRAMALGVAAGMLLVLLRPPLPIKGGARCPDLPLGLCPRLWDERHVPTHESDDLAMYGEAGLARREHWPLWLLVAAVMLGLGLSIHGGSGPETGPARRVVDALASGGLVGAYIALEFFAGQTLLQALLLGTTLLLAVFLVLLQLPTAAASARLLVLMVLWAASFPLALMLQAVSSLPALPDDSPELLFPDALREVEDERWRANRAAVLVVFAAQALLAAFAIKLKLARLRGEFDLGAAAPRAGGGLAARGPRGVYGGGLLGGGPRGKVPSWAAAVHSIAPGGLRGLQQMLAGLEGTGWLPPAGNCCTCAAFGLSLYLSSVLSEAPQLAVFVLAPLLLLLNYDPLRMYYIGEKQRYLPPAAAISVYLTGYAAVQLTRVSAAEAAAGSHLSAVGFFVRNVPLLLLALPNHVMFLLHLWQQHTSAAGLLPVLVATPLNGLVLLGGSKVQAVRLLAGTAAAMGVLQFFLARHARTVSSRLI